MYIFEEYTGVHLCDRCIASYGVENARLANYSGSSVLIPTRKVYYCIEHVAQIEKQYQEDTSEFTNL